jgi:hypothetical protein
MKDSQKEEMTEAAARAASLRAAITKYRTLQHEKTSRPSLLKHLIL